MSIPIASATASLADALTRVERWLGRLDVLDWVLIGGGIAILLWTWIEAIGRVRLGTIDVKPFNGDGSVATFAATAELQDSLARMGWRPASSVPGGSPTPASFAAAVQAAPLPQAQWLGALLQLIPTPASATGFTVGGTLQADTPPASAVTYELTALRSNRCVGISTTSGANRQDAIGAAANAIYRQIGAQAPDIYPKWSRWKSGDALALYLIGLNTETNPSATVGDPFRSALTHYKIASELEPENMLVRLRIANCLERLAKSPVPTPPEVSNRVEALEAYVEVRLRSSSMFEARYRISVLLGVLASDPLSAKDEEDLQKLLDRLEKLLYRLERDRDGQLDEGSQRQGRLTQTRSPELALTDPEEVSLSEINARQVALSERMAENARQEAASARKRLKPLWTIVHKGRFRHRFEPTGHGRRQLRKALGISNMCLKARSNTAASRPKQLYWRALVFWGYLAGRSHVAGWQAHYNAACFYALLLSVKNPEDPNLLCAAAFKHLVRAIRAPDQTLSCAYVRSDPDLTKLRDAHAPQWQAEVVNWICPTERDVT